MGDIMNDVEELVEAARISGAHPDESTNYREAHAALFEAVRAYGEACAAWERQKTIEAVISVANSLPVDAGEGFYQGYKLAIRNALAAIRATLPPE